MLILVGVVAAMWAVDAAVVRLRRDALGSMDRQVYYAIGLKNHKTEFERGDVETDTCARSLFPQMGFQPCWYMEKHPTKWVTVGSGRPEDF